MSEFTLPANSKVEKGRHWPLEGTAKRIKSFQVYHWDSSSGRNPCLDTFDIDLDDCGPMVLDALMKITSEVDPTLAFRRSCREGVCGSCSMNIDGVNTLACLTHMKDLDRDVSRISPLPHLQVLRDLIPHLTGLYAQYELIEPWLKNDQPPPDRERRQSPADVEKLDGLSSCILCFCCSTSCPSYWWNQDKYLGPAILLQAQRWISDTPDTHMGNAWTNLRTPSGCIVATR